MCVYICHPVLFPLGWFSTLCHKNKQKQGRTSPSRLAITRVLAKLGFLIGNLNASRLRINSFPFLFFCSFLRPVEMETYLLGYLQTIIMPLPCLPSSFLQGPVPTTLINAREALLIQVNLLADDSVEIFGGQAWASHCLFFWSFPSCLLNFLSNALRSLKKARKVPSRDRAHPWAWTRYWQDLRGWGG